VQLTKYYRQIQEQHVQLFAVSVDLPEASEALRQRLHCDFTFLSDPEGKILDGLNIRHRGGRTFDGGDVAFPAQVLVDKEGVVRWTYQSDYYRVRASPEQVFAAIAALPR
jgi:peroxiredoxin